MSQLLTAVVDEPLVQRTLRDHYECLLMERFSGKLHGLDPSCIADINAHKDGSYGFSYLGLALYANGHNAISKSSNFPRGLIYRDDDAIFGVGVFFRPEKENVPCLHIIAPRGNNWQAAVNKFMKKVRELIPNAEIFVRQLSFEQYKSLGPQTNLDRIINEYESQHNPRPLYGRIQSGNVGAVWTAIEANPWVRNQNFRQHVTGPSDETVADASGPDAADGRTKEHKEIWATQEDETYNHALINLDEVISTPEEGMFRNMDHLREQMPNGTKRRTDSVDKERRNYNGFKNFLARNNLTYELVPYTSDMEGEARELIHSHFDHLAERGKAVGSTAADYENIITASPADLHEAGVHMYMGYVSDHGGHHVPMSFYGLERTSPDTVCGYATINSYRSDRLDGIATEFKGFNNITAYADGQIMYRMKQEGMKYVNLGGSETRDLDEGKRLKGAQEQATYWAVASENDGFARAVSNSMKSQTLPKK